MKFRKWSMFAVVSLAMAAALRALDFHDNSGGGGGSASWSTLTGIPAGFSDGTDDGGSDTVATVNTTRSIVSTHSVVAASGSGGAITLTLPAASTAGRKLLIYKSDTSGNAITVTRQGSDSIEGVASVPLSAQFGSLYLVADGGTTWVRYAPSGFFNAPFNPDQAKLPGANPAGISNSTNAVTSSLLFDASTDESVTWSTLLTPHPGGTLKVDIFYSMLSATADEVIWNASIMCVSDGDAADVDAESFAAVGVATTTVAATAGHMKKITLTPTDDTCAANDLIILKLLRDADATGDDASGDAEVRKVRLYAE